MTTEVVGSIKEIGRDAWNACYFAEVEDYDYLLAVEMAGIEGFKWRYVVVRREGIVVAAMPAFHCRYLLETTLDPGRLRDAIEKVRRRFPRFLTQQLACLGSPCTETGVVGFHQTLTTELRELAFRCLVDAFELDAKEHGCVLIALKDISQPLDLAMNGILSSKEYVEVPGMPTAWLDPTFTSLEAYLDLLSSSTRKDMRRKLKAREKIVVKRWSGFGDLLPRAMQLYQQTRERSAWQFEDLTPAYFEGVLANMPGRSFCTMYFFNDKLLAWNLLLHDEGRLVDKFFCMDAEEGRAFNLYYLSWFENLKYCLENDIGLYQSGQAYYQNKVRLGSSLTRNSMYFRHRSPLLHTILRLLAPLLVSDPIKEQRK
ncbi:GNAT family N-acetyltransferase [Rhizobium vallis]|uniref:GNAT family N-acetyltransferase n=1 Tax=Rhizobium vallis TaxID=634290 RepID=A0A432PN16_9HYPH|nr:GNAT family N-acetyltransferase [Rhizobium vallis]RUM25842.1 GNAT family N-acetyltransferase [Rhizobium vallis]